MVGEWLYKGVCLKCGNHQSIWGSVYGSVSPLALHIFASKITSVLLHFCLLCSLRAASQASNTAPLFNPANQCYQHKLPQTCSPASHNTAINTVSNSCLLFCACAPGINIINQLPRNLVHGLHRSAWHPSAATGRLCIPQTVWQMSAGGCLLMLGETRCKEVCDAALSSTWWLLSSLIDILKVVRFKMLISTVRYSKTFILKVNLCQVCQLCCLTAVLWFS